MREYGYEEVVWWTVNANIVEVLHWAAAGVGLFVIALIVHYASGGKY